MLTDWRLLLAVLLVLCLHAACGGTTRQALAEDAVVLAFGDSLTRGKGVSDADSYPSVLSRLIQRPVLNYGVSGETTSDGLRRLPSVLAQTTPTLVILMHGGNDILRNVKRSETKAAMNAMIELALAQGAQVVLIGIPEKRLFSSSAGLYQELADQHSLAFDKSTVSTLLKQPAMKSDMVHFNEAGYAEIAGRIQALMVSEGLL